MTKNAEFVERTLCINCGSSEISELSKGGYNDPPLRDFIENDTWGVNPMQYLKEAVWSLRTCHDCGQLFHGFILNEEWNERRFSEWMSAEAIKAFKPDIGQPTASHRFDVGNGRVSHILRLRALLPNTLDKAPIK